MKILKYNILLLMTLYIVACGGVSDTETATETNDTHTDEQNDNDGKQAKPGEPWVPKGKNVYKAFVKIESNDTWLNELGIPLNKKESVVVNASNENVLTPGGGLDGALGGWATSAGLTAWQGAQLPDGTAVTDSLKAGQFAIFDTAFGWIYLAVGPRASGVASLQEAENIVKSLYINMLEKAYQDKKVKRIVLPAISTDIFAGGGKGFSKDEFIQAVFQGMTQAIDEFYEKDPQHTSLEIIINNWHTKTCTYGKPVIENIQLLPGSPTEPAF